MQSYRRPYVWLRRHKLACFLLMTVGFATFGLLSVDLVRLFLANGDYILNYGIMALQEGGLRQLLELTVTALVAMAAYVLFKFCESALISELTRRHDS